MEEKGGEEAARAAARQLASNRTWVQASTRAVEYVTIIDADMTVLFVNHTQPGVEEAVGSSCLRFIPPSQQQRMIDAVQSALSTGLPHHFETEATGPNGESSVYSGWATRMYGDFDKPRVVLVGTDITHIRRVEARLEVSDETLRSLVAHAPDYIAICDRSHCITFVNRSERPTATILGKTVESLLPENERAKVHQSIEHVFETGEPRSYDSTIPNPLEGGALAYFSTRLSPIYSGGEVMGVTLISTDMTAKTRAEQMVASTQEKLRQSQKLQAIGQLTGGIAHDFNNLLMVMQGSLELIRRKADDPETVLTYLDEARAATERATSLTQRLLAFGRRQNLSPETLDVRQQLESISTLMGRTLGPQLRIELSFADELRPCRADPVQLESSILNLGINARDAMGEGGGTLELSADTVRVGMAEAVELPELEMGDYVRIRVRDDGPGMPESVRSRVFEPFFTTKETGKGSGLGLSMVYGFAQQSGGHVTVRSELGEGTEVSIYLPSARAQSTPLPEQREERLLHDGQGRRVLIVEDMPAVAQLTRRMLEELGYEVLHAETGAAAVSCIEKNEAIDLVLSDVGLPGGISGVALAGMLRETHPELPIVLMTGFDHGQLDEGSEELDVLHKPFKLQELALALARHLEKG